MIGGLTKCQMVYDGAQTKSGLAGLIAGQLVLLQGGSPAIPPNGTFVGSPHVQVGEPAILDGGDYAGLYKLVKQLGKVVVQRL